jgi:sec-independent protein translocase protein TatB
MFDVGFSEIVLILGIALLVLGPEKLPRLANQVGRWAGRARAMARQLRAQLDEEVEVISQEDFGPATRRSPAAPQAPAEEAKPAPVQHAPPDPPNPPAYAPPEADAPGADETRRPS